MELDKKKNTAMVTSMATNNTPQNNQPVPPAPAPVIRNVRGIRNGVTVNNSAQRVDFNKIKQVVIDHKKKVITLILIATAGTIAYLAFRDDKKKITPVDTAQQAKQVVDATKKCTPVLPKEVNGVTVEIAIDGTNHFPTVSAELAGPISTKVCEQPLVIDAIIARDVAKIGEELHTTILACISGEAYAGMPYPLVLTFPEKLPVMVSLPIDFQNSPRLNHFCK